METSRGDAAAATRIFSGVRASHRRYAHAADPASGWRGSAAIAGYVVPPADGAALPPALVVRGERDFVDAASVEDWGPALGAVDFEVLPGCGHHGLLEDGDLYAAVWGEFWDAHD